MMFDRILLDVYRKDGGVIEYGRIKIPGKGAFIFVSLMKTVCNESTQCVFLLLWIGDLPDPSLSKKRVKRDACRARLTVLRRQKPPGTVDLNGGIWICVDQVDFVSAFGGVKIEGQFPVFQRIAIRKSDDIRNFSIGQGKMQNVRPV